MPLPGPPPCAIAALSDDPVLLEALGGAAQAGSVVTSSPTVDRFIDQLVANGAGLALIDAHCLATPLKGFLATLREQFPQLLLLLTGPAQLQSQFSAQIEDGTIFRFVHKPASSQRLRLFIEAAQRQRAIPDTPPVARAVAAMAARTGELGPPVGRSGSLKRAGMAAAAVVAAAVGWALWRHASTPGGQAIPATGPAAAGSAAPPELSAPGTESTATPSDAQVALEQAQRSAQGARADQVALYVQLVRKRVASGALIEPADDSARFYLESAVTLAPDDPEVRAASVALGEALISRFRHAVNAGDVAEAQRWLKACDSYRIGTASLGELSAQLQKLQAAQAAPPEPSRTPASARGPAPVPGAGTAATAATAPTTAPPPVAGPAPNAASNAAPAPSALPTAAAAAGAVSNAPQAAALPAPPAPAAALLPAPAVAPAGNAPPAIVSESSLTRVLFVPPEYPRAALDRGISGWVDLEFTVTAEGKVADIIVLGSEPHGIFEQTARSALARDRYQPVVRDGVPVVQRTRIRVRFKL